MRTTINDRGEEVTEEVWEDTQEAAGGKEEQVDGAVAAQPQASPSPTDSPAKEDEPLKEQPGQLPVQLDLMTCVLACWLIVTSGSVPLQLL